MADTGGSAAQRNMGTGSDTLLSSTNDRGATQRGPATGETANKESDVLKEALRRADEAYVMEKDNITAGRDCQKFYAGKDYDQWDEAAKTTRSSDGRPILQINRLPQFVRQMTGDLRKNPPELKFLPAKEGASQEAAEALNGIKRNIDAQSNGKDCYVIATENAAIAGQGAWRIVTEYADDQGFDLDIRKRPLRDPFGFLVDPYATEPDKSDMQYAFIYDNLSVNDFNTRYPGKTASDMPNSDTNAFPWRRGQTVRVAEYWVRETEKATLHLLPDGTVADKAPEGVEPLKSRDIERVSVRYWIINGKEVLSGPHEWAGKYIPLCVVTGEEIAMDGAVYRKGMVHDARDPQRVYNYMRSVAVEATALQPKAPFIGTVEHFKGYEKVWRTAGSKNHAFLPYNVDKMAPTSKPERAAPPIASQGLDTQSAIAASDMEAVIGIYKPALGAPSNETSGIAIARRQQEADTGTYLYPDNLARAISYEGKILADLIPKIYDQARVVRILKEDGTADLQEINQPPTPEMDEKTGMPKQKPVIDLSAGQYDVVVSTGPSFASKRAESAANMVELVRAVPGLAQVAGDLLIKNMDFPGADEIAKRLERMMPPGIKDDGPVQPPPPDPAAQAQAAKDAAAAHKTEAEAQGQEIQNVQLLMQMHATLQAVQAMLAGGAPPMPGGPPPPGGMPQAPPPAPPEMPPMAEAPMDAPMGGMDAGMGAPPMAELPEGIAPV